MGKSHPHALPEPGMNLSTHPAPIGLLFSITFAELSQSLFTFPLFPKNKPAVVAFSASFKGLFAQKEQKAGCDR